MRKVALSFTLSFLLVLAACAPARESVTPTPITPLAATHTPTAALPSASPLPTEKTSAAPTTPSLSASTPSAAETLSTQEPHLPPKYWTQWEILPPLSPTAREILARGLQNGNDPHFFTRIGDCQAIPGVFLGIYTTDNWTLPEEYAYAEPTIDFFAEAFAMENVTVKEGFGISSVLNPLFSDKEQCQPTESPLECELRIHHPIAAFIAMGTNWIPGASASFEKYLRQTVAILAENGTLPILVTKPDNIEGDQGINRAIAQVAYDEDLPLLNIWRALDFLPAHGLESDGEHMTADAWRIRNLYALLMLDQIRNAILELESP